MADGDGTFGFDRLHALLDGRQWIKRFDRHMKRAHAQVGEKFVQMAADAITAEKPYAANAPLTVALKRSSTPLVNHGDLVGSLTYQVRDLKTLRVGVNSRRVGRSRRFLAEILHNGATITVTPRMRQAFFAVMQSRREDGKGLPAGVKGMRGPGFIVIPPRPFIARPLGSKELRKFAVDRWLTALATSLRLGNQTHGAAGGSKGRKR